MREIFYKLAGRGQVFRNTVHLRDGMHKKMRDLLCIIAGAAVGFYEFAQNLLH